MRYHVLDLCRYYGIIDQQDKRVLATINKKQDAYRICELLNGGENAGGQSDKEKKERAFSRNKMQREAVSPFIEASEEKELNF